MVKRVKKEGVSKERGVTLIELIVAMAIFLCVIIGIVTMLHSTMQNIIISKEATIAINICQEEIEAIKNMAYNDIPCPATFTDSPYPPGKFPPVLYGATFTTCTTPNNAASCTVISHDHKDLIVEVGKHTGTKTIEIIWVDDPADGTGTTNAQNYKKVTVTTSWGEGKALRKRSMDFNVCNKQ
ncbi:MAG: prepilin-type N-terminal cleavage/methylation domain-containing protein [bacterium]|nr:prepilin-type N-terminal cleavage/methylation domain-containing protein [bacterium]